MSRLKLPCSMDLTDTPDQFAEWNRFYDKYVGTLTVEGALQSYRHLLQTEADAGKDLRKQGKSPGGQSLMSHHAKLNAQGYVPPPPKEYPAVYKGKKSTKYKLTDKEAIFCRDNVGKLGNKELARRYGVTRRSMQNITQGLTYKHLNLRPAGK